MTKLANPIGTFARTGGSRLFSACLTDLEIAQIVVAHDLPRTPQRGEVVTVRIDDRTVQLERIA